MDEREGLWIAGAALGTPAPQFLRCVSAFWRYLADTKATATKPTTTTSTAPRETAIAGAGSTSTTPSAARNFLLGQYQPKEG